MGGDISAEAKDLIEKLLVKTPKRRLSAGDVLMHPWLNNNNTAELTTPAKIRKNNSSRELSLFAESAAAVNRVVLQHMLMNLGFFEMEVSAGQVSGLSPPSESRLMQRRKSLQNSQSLQLNRISSNGSKVLSIKDLIGPVPSPLLHVKSPSVTKTTSKVSCPLHPWRLYLSRRGRLIHAKLMIYGCGKSVRDSLCIMNLFCWEKGRGLKKNL